MIKIYVLKDCPYSNAALSLLDDHKIPYKRRVVSLEKKQYYKNKNRMPTFPQIFIKDKKTGTLSKIGGYSELKMLLK